MKKHLTTITVLLVLLASVMSACSPRPAAPAAVPTRVPPTKPAATLAPTKVPASPAASTPAASTPGTGTPSSSVPVPVTGLAAKVNVATVGSLGSILVDANGRTLYIFKGDTPNSGKSACESSDCLKAWAPLITDSKPAAGEGVNASMLGTITRSSGLQQVTYNGWPLYHYLLDYGQGTANGQAFKGQWFVIGPDGTPITAALPAPAATKGPATQAAPTSAAGSPTPPAVVSTPTL